MDTPTILVIDDSLTIRKMVDCHLTQMGHRVVLAADGDAGVRLAQQVHPDLILLDHQLPGATGTEVCQRLLATDGCAAIPVVVSSGLRKRAYAEYTHFPNVVDALPKPFTPELLKSAVYNALETGRMVVKSQQTGEALPEAMGAVHDPVLEGDARLFRLPRVVDFLNHLGLSGLLTIAVESQRIQFYLGGGRIQAVTSPTFDVELVMATLPADLGGLAPLLRVSIGTLQKDQIASLVNLLDRSLLDQRRLRALLRHQAAVLSHAALTGTAGRFSFEPDVPLPTLFAGFPLQLSLVALAIDGVRQATPADDECDLDAVYVRQVTRGQSLDRSGLSAAEIKVFSRLDGTTSVARLAAAVGLRPTEAATILRGFDLLDMVALQAASTHATIVVLENDPDTVQVIQETLATGQGPYQVRFVRDRLGAQILLKRSSPDLLVLSVDPPENRQFVQLIQADAGLTSCKLVGIVQADDEETLIRLDALGLDGLLQRPIGERDLRTTLDHVLGARGQASEADRTPLAPAGPSRSNGVKP